MASLATLGRTDRWRCAGLILGPVTFISAWAIAGARTPGYSPIRDHISDLAAVGAPTAPLMNAAFATFVIVVTPAIGPVRRSIGTPTAVVLGVNIALTAAIALAPLGRSMAGDRLHNVVAGAGYLALGALALSAVPSLWPRNRAAALASGVVGSATLASLAASIASSDLSGLWQRAGITVTDGWMIAVGVVALTGVATRRPGASD
jgi:hypothetical membrane protein